MYLKHLSLTNFRNFARLDMDIPRRSVLLVGSNAQGKEGPNITMSKTAGIGAWTYQQFHDAVRLAKDKDGTDLCVFMTKFPESEITEAGMQDLYAFIGSKPVSDVVNKGSYCP